MTGEEKAKLVMETLRAIAEKLTPVVVQIVEAGSSGSIEHHFQQGQYKSSRIKELTL